ncbi:MAG TPA: radical SAM family heme chaperone HemW [Armatimonadota bacterium]
MSAESIYVHIPFCVSKCLYCDFTSYPGKDHLIGEYVEALKSEIRLYASRFPGTHISTVYFGGGTPNVLKPEQLGEILDELKGSFEFDAGAEISTEANPGISGGADEGVYPFRLLRDSGFNRLSLGIQSFNDDELRLLGRAHNSAQAVQGFRSARESGFDNISIDLMYGIPVQSLDSWRKTLDDALALDSEHISLYSLTVEEGTPFSAMQGAGKLELPGDDLEADMYEEAILRLTAGGYTHYEISNFAKPGRECRHNMTYWRNEGYFGFGAGAVSYLDGVRTANISQIEEYIEKVKSGETPAASSESLAARESMGETMFLGLRTMKGIDCRVFENRYGISPDGVFGTKLAAMVSRGLVERTHGFIRLTERGLMLANEVFAEFV